MFLTSCAGESFEIIQPPIVEYPTDVQFAAVEELDRLKPPCAVFGQENCSYLGMFMMDYFKLREWIRGVKE